MSSEAGAYMTIAAFTIVPFIAYVILNVIIYRILTTLGIKPLYYIAILFLLSTAAYGISLLLYTDTFIIFLFLPCLIFNLYYTYYYAMLAR